MRFAQTDRQINLLQETVSLFLIFIHFRILPMSKVGSFFEVFYFSLSFLWLYIYILTVLRVIFPSPEGLCKSAHYIPVLSIAYTCCLGNWNNLRLQCYIWPYTYYCR